MQISRIQATPQRKQNPQAQPSFKRHLILTGNPHAMTDLIKTFRTLQEDTLNYGLQVRTSMHLNPEKVVLGVHVPDKDSDAIALTSDFYTKAIALYNRDRDTLASIGPKSTLQEYTKCLDADISKAEGNMPIRSCNEFLS